MLIGAHVSNKKPFSDAVLRAEAAHCECFQLFSNQSVRWKPKAIPDEEMKRFVELNEKKRIKPVIIHAIYLINLASHNTFFYKSSIASLKDDMEKAKRLGAMGVNFHVGSTKGRKFEDVLGQIVDAISEVLDSVEGPDLLLENTAGAGNIIGDTFEEIQMIIKKVNSKRLKVTLDTAHVYESGYDIASPGGLKQTLRQFDDIIGLDRLVCFHLNDSESYLNSNSDRHEDIGHGHIGEEVFKELVCDPRFLNVPGIVETPGRKVKDNSENVITLKRLRDED